MVSNMYQVEVLKLVDLNKVTKSIRFKFVDKKQAKEFTFSPGQYLMVGMLGYGEAPLTITTAQIELPEFEIAAKSVGVATQALHRLKVGDRLYVRGPLGNTLVSQKIYGHQLILVAGGLGLAPLRSIIQTIGSDSAMVGELVIVCGARTPEDLLYKGELKSWEKFAKVRVIVDKADHQWSGEKGRVTDVLESLTLGKDAVAIVCGPPVMYQSVAKSLMKKGLKEDNMEFMLERRMKCGIGKCQHCTCGDKYVCIDGPTFTWKEISENQEASL